MSKRSEDRIGRGNAAGHEAVEGAHGTRGAWARRLAMFGVLFAATLAAGVLMASCGGRSDDAVTQATPARSVGSDAEPVAAVASAVPMEPAPESRPLRSGEAAVGTLPPDVAVAPVDTLVTPGQSMVFTVEGTPDVASIALSDGIGDALPLVKVAGTNTWQVPYRVPLHPRKERYGVSITARNDAGRWCRVWVFLHVDDGSPKPDTAETIEAPPADEK